jgi:Ca2+:H+ antiporter
MKEASPASDSYIFRIRSWASSKAYGLSPFSKDKSRPPTLPLNNHHVHHEDAHQTVLPATCQLDGIAPLAANPTANHVADQTSPDNPPPAPPPQAEGQGPVVEDEQPNKKKKNIAVRFWLTAKSIILSSYINLLLVLVPVGIAAKAAGLKPGIVFGLNAVAIIPLAGLLSHATESVAKRMGDTVGALMNVTFGNAVELIILYVCVPPLDGPPAD